MGHCEEVLHDVGIESKDVLQNVCLKSKLVDNNKESSCSCGSHDIGKFRSYVTANKSDPTLTSTLRRLFVNQFVTRFRAITSVCNRSIVDNNCFGWDSDSYYNPSTAFLQKVVVPNSWKKEMYPIGMERFKFNTTSEKISGFMTWLKDMEKASIFQTVRLPSTTSVAYNPIWADLYISTAYKKGIQWARRKLREDTETLASIGKTRLEIDASNEAILTAFGHPVHADRVASLFTRNFTDLVGITAAMDTEISRILAEGLIAGRNPRVLAKEIADRISAIGIHRATLLARTEVIRSHHLASIQEYRNAGLFGVKVLAEWVTAGDSRVCELCYALEGKIFTLNEIEGMIPLHPQCRCAAVPAVLDVAQKEWKKG